MNRTMALLAPLLALLLTVTASCTRDQGAPKASSTPAKPLAQIAATPMAKAPVAEEDEDVDPNYPDDMEDLYVDLDADPDEGAPPLSVQWTSIVEDGTEPYTYKWNFGDGSPESTEVNPAHVYQKAGDYTATLTVKDAKGLWGSEEYDIVVEADE
jgi:PKD repeat protein